VYSEKSLRRFFEKTIPDGDCVKWIGAKNRKGYGRTYDSKKRPAPAHRVAWEIKNGPFPEGMLALHSCDKPDCVNPDHIRPGTHKDNMKDREERGRTNRPFVGGVCQNGHRLDEGNIYYDGPSRRCRQCRTEYWSEREKTRPKRNRGAA